MKTDTKPTSNEAENGNKSKPLLSSRLLKFRAWITIDVDDQDNDIKAMTYDLAFSKYAPINELLNKEEFLMQFTGLIDKNGKEIYEGDLILDEEYDDEGNDISSNLEVLYDNETARYVVDNSFAKTRTSLVSIVNYIGRENLQVIGNIFENPELL